MISLIVTKIENLGLHCIADEVEEPDVDSFVTYKFCTSGAILKELNALYQKLVKYGKNINNIPDDMLFYFFLKPLDSENGIIFKYYVTESNGKSLLNYPSEFINSFRIIE
jgi:hypothetical protein